MKSSKVDFALVVCLALALFAVVFDSQSMGAVGTSPTCDGMCRERWAFNNQAGDGQPVSCSYYDINDCSLCVCTGEVFGQTCSCEVSTKDMNTTKKCKPDMTMTQYQYNLGVNGCGYWCPLTGFSFAEASAVDPYVKGKQNGNPYRCTG